MHVKRSFQADEIWNFFWHHIDVTYRVLPKRKISFIFKDWKMIFFVNNWWFDIIPPEAKGGV